MAKGGGGAATATRVGQVKTTRVGKAKGIGAIGRHSTPAGNVSQHTGRNGGSGPMVGRRGK